MIKQWTGKAIAIVAMVITLSLGFSNSADAYGGSWGSSRGGFGSGGGSWGGGSLGGGSMGGGGLLGGRRPLRNLLGLVGSGVSAVGSGLERLGNIGGGSHGSMGSTGGLGSGGGLLGGGRLRDRWSGGGSHGGWSSTGSTGGLSSTGSFGLAHSSTPAVGGSTGYSSWSSGLSYGLGSTGYSSGYSTGLYSGSATENYYGDWGSSYLSDASDLSYPVSSFDSSYPMSTYDSGFASYDSGLMSYDSGLMSYDSGLNYGSIEDAYSSPVNSFEQPFYDSGSMIGNTLESYGVPGAVETGYDSPVLDFGASPSFDNSIDPQPGSIFGPINGGDAPGSGFGDGLPDAPIPDADADSTELRQKKSEAVLSLKLPKEAKVYINGKLTKTEGRLRQYVSRNLTKGKNYRYRVKAVVEKDGREIVRTQLVSMSPGKDRLIKFKFDQPQVTTLVLKVPRDAKVLLDGKETKAKGKIRTFSTRKLSNEQSWNDYKIEVRYVKDGKQVVEHRSVNLVAGTTEMLAMGGTVTGPNNELIETAIAKN